MSTDNMDPKGWTAARVREHLQNAVYLEMWTVPLYLTAAYSLDVPINPNTSRPEFASVPMKDGKPDFSSFTQTDYNQYAFNNILSVAIQEMLHVELAGNVLNAVRPVAATSPVNFTATPSDYTTVPVCVADGTLPSGVTLGLGPCNENQTLLFQWVESDAPVPPGYDVEAWHAAYTSIGHFYTSLMYGVKACWSDLYPSEGRASDPFQRDDWEASARRARGGFLLNAIFAGIQPANAVAAAATSGTYSFSIKIFGTQTDALTLAQAALAGIVAQGEGAGEGDTQIPTQYQLTTGDTIEVALDTVTHWERFTQLVSLAQEGKFTYVQPVANPDHDHFLTALNQSYSSFLADLNYSFSGSSMSIAAMAGLGNRSLQAWQNNVTAEEMFAYVDGSKFIDPTGAKGYHACQGLDAAGTSDCATGFYHTCAGTNMCKNQGGCGAKMSSGEKNIVWLPNSNDCQGKGHCGIPIPALQCCDTDGSNPLNGQSVWDYARKLLSQPTDEPLPNDLRTALTATGGKCNPTK